jgi:hypothetical protein
VPPDRLSPLAPVAVVTQDGDAIAGRGPGLLGRQTAGDGNPALALDGVEIVGRHGTMVAS